MTPTIRTTIAGTLVAGLAALPAAVSAQQSRGTVRPSPTAALGIHGFSVVLVVGSLSGTAAASSEAVPEAARKALADMKDFLPYKRYQLLDAGWMICCAGPHGGVSGHVRGPEDRDFRYEVDPIGVSDTKLDVRFTIRAELREALTASSTRTAMHPAEVEYSRAMVEAIQEREAAERELQDAQKRHRAGLMTTTELRALEARTLRSQQAEQRVKDLRAARQNQSAQRASRVNLIDSTFSISLGETVVVGTSRLNGDSALIAILTAAAKPAPAQGR